MGDDLGVSDLGICGRGIGSMNLRTVEDVITIKENGSSGVNSCGSGSKYIPNRSIFLGANVKITQNTWRSGYQAYLLNVGYSDDNSSNNTSLGAVFSDQTQNTLFDFNSDIGNTFQFYGDSLPYNTINAMNKFTGVEIKTPSVAGDGNGDNHSITFEITLFFMVIGKGTDKIVSSLKTTNFQYYSDKSKRNSSFTIETKTQSVILGSGTSTVTDLKIENGVYYGSSILVKKTKPGKITQVTLGVGYIYEYNLDTSGIYNKQITSNYHCINNIITPSSLLINHESECQGVEIELTIFYSIVDNNIQDTIQSKLPKRLCTKLNVQGIHPGKFQLEAIKVNIRGGKIQTPYAKKLRMLGISFNSRNTILDMLQIQNVIVAIGIWKTKDFYAVNIESNSDGVFPYSEFTTIEGDPNDVDFYIYAQFVY
jgi:hypothetical protein